MVLRCKRQTVCSFTKMFCVRVTLVEIGSDGAETCYTSLDDVKIISGPWCGGAYEKTHTWYRIRNILRSVRVLNHNYICQTLENVRQVKNFVYFFILNFLGNQK